MARLFTCGFELQDPPKEGGWINSGGVRAVGSTSIKRSGAASALCDASAGSGVNTNGETWDTNGSASTTPLFIRGFAYITAFPTLGICEFFHVSSFIGFYLNTSGELQMHDGVQPGNQLGSSFPVNLNQWYRLDIEVDSTPVSGSRIRRGYVDGTLVGQTTTSTTTGTAASLRTATGNGAVAYFDDLAVNDNVGSYENSFPNPDGKVVYLRPVGDGDADTGSPTRAGADSGTIWGQLDEVAPNDATDYVVLPANPSDVWVTVTSTATAGIGASDAVSVVEVHARQAAASATSSNWFPQIESQSGGTKVSATAVVLASASWFTNDDTSGATFCKLIQHRNPQDVSTPWTPALLNTTQISAKTTDGNPDTWVSALWAIVEYVPEVVIAGPIPDRNLVVGQSLNRGATF